MNKIIITDSSLRDGNHAVKHTINLDSIERYCKFADEAGIPIVEVGHGNGLGASSLLIGQSPFTDEQMLMAAKENLKTSKLGIHIIPGIATIKKDIYKAICKNFFILKRFDRLLIFYLQQLGPRLKAFFKKRRKISLRFKPEVDKSARQYDNLSKIPA